jgi:phosphorylcholine metabolism protein LicD
MQDVIQQDRMVVDTLLISDEAKFLLSVFVNKQNYHYWAETTQQTSTDYNYMHKWLMFGVLSAQ